MGPESPGPGPAAGEAEGRSGASGQSALCRRMVGSPRGFARTLPWKVQTERQEPHKVLEEV